MQITQTPTQLTITYRESLALALLILVLSGVSLLLGIVFGSLALLQLADGSLVGLLLGGFCGVAGLVGLWQGGQLLHQALTRATVWTFDKQQERLLLTQQAGHSITLIENYPLQGLSLEVTEERQSSSTGMPGYSYRVLVHTATTALPLPRSRSTAYDRANRLATQIEQFLRSD